MKFRPNAIHLKSQKLVQFLGFGRMQTDVPLHDMDEVALYREGNGEFWSRRSAEWVERFQPYAGHEVAIEFTPTSNVPPGVAVAVLDDQILYLGPAAQMPDDPRVKLWPMGVVVSLHPITYRKMVKATAKLDGQPDDTAMRQG